MKRLLSAACVFFASLAVLGAAAPERPSTREALLQRGEARIFRDLSENRITRREAAVYRTQFTFAPDRLPEEYKLAPFEERPWCATSVVREIWSDWHLLDDDTRSLLPSSMRPAPVDESIFVAKGSLQLGVVGEGILAAKTDPGDFPFSPAYDRTYATTNFLIHWISTGAGSLVQNQDSNSNGIPDMVEQSGAAFETTRSWLLARGYRLPLDTETHYLNVYFEEMPFGMGAYARIVDYPSSYSRAFIAINTDLSGWDLPDGTPLNPFDLVRTIATHEYMHACQFAYDAMEDAWWMEATAVWVEDLIGPTWDSVNTYLIHMVRYLYIPEVALDDPYNSWHWYASSLWAMFMHTHIDPDGSIIREIWEECDGQTNALNANRNVLAGYVPGGFDEAWLDFLVANYEADYPEASEFPDEYGMLWIEPNIYTYPAQNVSTQFPPAGLGSNYVRLYPTAGPGYKLTLNWFGSGASTWAGVLMSEDGGIYTRRDTFPSVPASVPAFTDGVDEAVLIVTPTTAGLYYELAWSFSAYLEYGDSVAPAPNPMTFQTAPHATGATAISMTASEAVDAASPPVEYQFEESLGAPGGSDTGWAAGRTYTDTGLSVNTRYVYRVRARDSAAVPNTTAWSAPDEVYTLANTPVAPVLSDPAPTKLYITTSGADGNPSYTEYALYNATAGNYVGSSGMPSGTPSWATRDAWNSARILGLTPATTYAFALKARNGDGIETAFSSAGNGTTLAADTTPPAVYNVAIIPTWVKENITTSVTITATGTDSARGGSDITWAEYYIDSDPGAGSATPMQPADGALNSPTEALTATLNTTGWSYVESPYHLYVRVLDEANLWSAPAHYEIQVVDGIPPNRITDLQAQPAAPDIAEVVALTLDSATSQTPGHEAARAADGSAVSSWITAAAAEPTAEQIVLDIGSDAWLSKVELYPGGDLSLFPADFKVKLFDGTAWYAVVTQTGYAADPGANAWQFGARKAEQIKIEISRTPLHTPSGLYAAEIGEIVLYTESGGSRSVELSWTAPADTGPTGRAAQYQVHYSADPGTLTSGFGGENAPDAPPAPAAPGVPQGMTVTGLDPGSTLYFAVRSRDDYDNFSEVSTVAVTSTLPDPNPYVALDAPADESVLDIPTPPVFSWHANMYDNFRVQFSNVPDFPLRPYKDELARLAKTMRFGVRRGETTFEPSVGQWRTLKRLAASMDGTLYWRVEARALRNRQLGVGYSEVFAEYGFDTGTFIDLEIGPYHISGTNVAVWPNNRPQFVWYVTNPVYATFYLDFAATPDINIHDRRNTYSVRSRNGSRTWCRPTSGQWRTIKRKFAAANAGLIYWRVRGIDDARAFQAASDAQPLLIDSPTFNLRKPAPRRDGSVHPDEGFTLDWGVNAEGYPYFRPQISTSPDFAKGPGTFNLPLVKNGASVDVKRTQTRRIGKLLERAGGGDTFYWRVLATDTDRTITVESGSQEVVLSVEPIGGTN